MATSSRPANKRIIDPETGRLNLEWDAYFARLEQLLSTTLVGGVTSFEGRTGIVTGQSGDYTASEITNVAAGNISSVTVQDAIDELDTEKQPADATLTALAAYNTNGLIAQTAPDTFAGRTLTGPAAGITVSNGNGVAGNPTLALANDLAAIEGLGSTGLAARTGADAWAQRTITGPAAGITVSNGDGVSGNPTIALANDLAALEGLGSTGIAVRTAADAWAQRTITGTANEITVTNGDGVSGNPTMSLPATIDLGGKTSLEIPNSAAPTVDADGEIAVDTSVTDFSHGILKYYSGEELACIAVPIAELTAPSDGDVITYNAAADEFRLEAPSSTGSTYTLATEQATTSGTSFDFTGIGATATRITVIFNEVSLSGTDNLLIQIGDSGGVETTGYIASGGVDGAIVNSTAGFIVRMAANAQVFSGLMTLVRINSLTWVASHAGKSNTNLANMGGGSKTLSATLDRVRLTVTGVNTFDAGSVNILWE